MNIKDKKVLVTGGTGSLGQMLVSRMLSGEYGQPEQIVVFSRDEARQHAMRQRFDQRGASTDEVIYEDWDRTLSFRIGDVRDPVSVRGAIRGMDIVINAAAMKQVPTCEYFPGEAFSTNVQGAANIANAIRELSAPPGIVLGISTDKAVKPVNVMGMTKALQERLFIRANIDCPDTRFVLVRYGNVIASRGSVVPLFLQQIQRGGPITITDPGMTRFLLSMDNAIDTITNALEHAKPGEIVIPRIPSALMTDLAKVLAVDRDFPLQITGIRPGEKLHEILVSEEEAPRAMSRGKYFAIRPMLPELGMREYSTQSGLQGEYSSSDNVLTIDELEDMVGGMGSFHSWDDLQ